MSEAGHARNVGNFEILTSSCVGYGTIYDPVKPLLFILALESKLTAGQSVLDAVSVAYAAEKLEINDRQDEYEGIRKFVTRVINSFEVSGASDKDVADARSLKRKLDGARAHTLVVPAEGDPPTDDDSISVSQQSYVQIVEHLSGIIDLIEASGVYDPNEIDLKLANVKLRRDALKTATTAVIDKMTTTKNARIARDAELYADETGLYDIAMDVKKYVKSIFGASAPEYKQISGLRFDRY